MQGIINWIPVNKTPSIAQVYNIIYRDAIERDDHIGFAAFDNGWKDLNGKIFTRGFIRYYGLPELTTKTEQMWFTSYVAHKLCGVQPRAFSYWIHDGKIHGMRDKAGKRWLFSLSEINRIRRERGMKALTIDEATSVWESEIANKKYGIKK